MAWVLSCILTNLSLNDDSPLQLHQYCCQKQKCQLLCVHPQDPAVKVNILMPGAFLTKKEALFVSDIIQNITANALLIPLLDSHCAKPVLN